MKNLFKMLSPLAFLILLFIVLPLVICFLCIGISYLLNSIFPVIGIDFYFIGSALILYANIFVVVYGLKPKLEDKNFLCEDCLRPIVENELNNPLSRDERRHPKSKKRRK